MSSHFIHRELLISLLDRFINAPVSLRGLAVVLLRQLQKVMYKERYIACEFDYEMDYVAYANSFGITAEAVSTQEEFAEAFRKAMEAEDEPRVIVMNVWRSFVEPMTKGGARIDEFVEFK